MNRKDRRAQQAGQKGGALNPMDDPRFATAVQHLQGGDLAGAAHWAEQALQAQPRDADRLHLLGVIRLQLGQPAEAVALLTKALSQRPALDEARLNLTLALCRLQNFPEAEREIRKLLPRHPDPQHPNYAPTRQLYATILRQLGKLEEAAQEFSQLLAQHPEDGEGWSNYGLTLRSLDRRSEAIDAFRHAIQARPDLAAAHNNLGALLLAQGEFAEGFAEQDWRWRTPERQSDLRAFPQPWWQGEDLAGKTLLLWSEQGPGDQILAATALPALTRRGVKLIIECKPRMSPLFARAFPQAQIVERSDPPHPATLAPDIAAQLPLGSLSRWLPPDQVTPEPWLVADGTRAAELRARYQQAGQPEGTKSNLLVGLAWRSKNATVGQHKSLDLAAWAPLLHLPGITFVNLQYGDVAEEIAAARAATGAKILEDADIDQMADMDAFTAQVAALDLIIANSQTVVHVAGGLGRPVWTLLPLSQGLLWYWGLAGEACAFYPSMRLLRQSQRGIWEDVIAEAAQRLAGQLQGDGVISHIR